MEYLEGRISTTACVACVACHRGRGPRGQASRIGVECRHEQGIVHRDLKPGNIFLVQIPGEPDFVKVLDFGTRK